MHRQEDNSSIDGPEESQELMKNRIRNRLRASLKMVVVGLSTG